MIKILYIGENTDQLSLNKTLSISNGFSTDFLSKWPKKNILLDHGLPDLICLEEQKILDVEKIIDEIKIIFSPFPPAVFAIIPKASKTEDFLAWNNSPADKVLTLPICPDHIKKAVSVYVERRLLHQQCKKMKAAQKKSTGLLDRFYEEMKILKQELIDERHNMNQTFKQLQTLTLQRDKMKQKFAQMEKLWYQDQKGMEEILRTLIVKQVETNKGHGDRVAAIADFLAVEIGINQEKRTDLAKAAILYQLGRLTIPDAESDSDIQIQHPVKGAKLLALCNCFQDASEIVKGIHEKSDGSGYPNGFKRQYIPILTRILTGAIVFDSLKDLPEVKDTDSLLNALEKEAGTSLDPHIAGLLEKYIALHMGPEAGERLRGLGVEQLKPGMRLGCSIFTHTGSKLFSAGTLLDKDAVNKVLRYNRSYPVDDIIYIKG